MKNPFFCCIMLVCGDIDNKIGKGEEMRLKRVHSAFLATVLTCSLAVTPVFAEPTQSELEDQKAAAQSELEQFQAELDDIVAKTSELENKLIAKGEEILQAEDDLEEAEAKREDQYEAMKLRIKFMYESGSASAAMEKVVTSGNISDMLSQAEYSQKVHEYDREQLQEYANTVTQIEELHTQLEEDMEALQEAETEYKNQQQVLKETISSKESEITNLDEMIQEAARKAEEERLAALEEEQNNTPPAGGGSTGGGTTAPPYNPVTGNVVVDRAYGCIELPYVWAATGPDAFDCSGLVGYCLTGSYSRLGTTNTFMGWPRVSDPQPGDVCTSWEHCGIYIGGGQMIHAPEPGDVVKIGPVQSGMIFVRYGG